MMKLSRRLQRIAQFVDREKSVIDVGTDHGFVPNFLCAQGMKAPIYATDISASSLEKSQKFAEKLGNDHRIIHQVTNGLQGIEDIEQIIIAGMGGILISEIIKADFSLCQRAVRLILQPMQASDVLRIFLYEQGFTIDVEELVDEGGKYFEIIVAHYTGQSRKISPFDAKVSPLLQEEPHPLFYDFVRQKVKYNQYILSQMDISTEKSKRRKEELEEENRKYEVLCNEDKNR